MGLTSTREIRSRSQGRSGDPSIRVVFCAPYPVETLVSEALLRNPGWRSHPCTWIRVLENALLDSGRVELHIMTASHNVIGDQHVVNGSTHYHLMDASLPDWVTKAPGVHPTSSLWIRPLWKMIRRIRKIDPDLVHGHGTEGCFSLAAVYSGRPHLVSIQGIIDHVYEEDPSVRYWFVKKAEAHTVRRAGCINAKTQVSLEFVKEIAPDTPTYFIEPPINHTFWEGAVPFQRRTLFFVGSVIRRKGIEEFLEAYLALKRDFAGLTAYVIGDGEIERYKNFLLDRASTLHANDVQFTGLVPQSEIADLYQGGGVFCLPSHVENSPNSLMEAMAAGLPVVATDVGAIDFLVENGESGLLVPKGEVESLRSALGRLLEDSQMHRAFGRRGREIATSRWRPELIATQHLKMYDQIVRGSRKAESRKDHDGGA